MRTVVPRFTKTPAFHDGCEEEEQPSRQAPMRNAAMRRARFVVPCRRPRRPRHRPRQQSCHVLCSIPRRSRAFNAAHAPRQRLPQACAPGHPDIFDRRDSVVSSIRLRKPGSSTLPVLLPPLLESLSRHEVPSASGTISVSQVRRNVLLLHHRGITSTPPTGGSV